MKTLNKQSNGRMRIQILTIALLFIATSLKAQEATNFTGNWLRNTAKCDAGNLSVNSIPVSILVDQSKSQMQIKRVSKTAQGDSTAYTEEIKFDGSTAMSLVKSNLNKNVSATWSADHKQLTEIANYTDAQGNPVQKGKENWTLSDDGKTLTIQTIILADGKDYQLTEVFDKK